MKIFDVRTFTITRKMIEEMEEKMRNGELPEKGNKKTFTATYKDKYGAERETKITLIPIV